jgi:hypothetical protein
LLFKVKKRKSVLSDKIVIEDCEFEDHNQLSSKHNLIWTYHIPHYLQRVAWLVVGNLEKYKKSLITGKWSLDQISLDIFSWSKVCVKLGVWSKLLFFYFGQLIKFHLIFSVDQKFY